MNEQPQTKAIDLPPEIVEAMSAMERYALYVGIQRGIMMVLNTLMVKYMNMDFQAYQKLAIKPQIHAIAPLGKVMGSDPGYPHRHRRAAGRCQRLRGDPRRHDDASSARPRAGGGDRRGSGFGRVISWLSPTATGGT